MAVYQAPPSLGFSRQEHWSGLPFPSPMHESERWKWSRSVVSDCQRPHGLQPTRLLCPWDFPGKRTGVGCHCLLWSIFSFSVGCLFLSVWFPFLYTSLQVWLGPSLFVFCFLYLLPRDTALRKHRYKNLTTLNVSSMPFPNFLDQTDAHGTSLMLLFSWPSLSHLNWPHIYSPLWSMSSLKAEGELERHFITSAVHSP